MAYFCYTFSGTTERANALPSLTNTTLVEADMATPNLRQNDSKSNPRPTYERVRELLSYDPATGAFTRLQRIGRCHPGPVVGGRTSHGYINITIDGRRNYAHRLAYLLMTGNWPDRHMDHIDGNGANNKWSNLRPATQAQNLANRGPARRNRSGFKGIYAHYGKWIASVSFEGKVYRSKSCATKEEAAQLYREMALRVHGEFARFVPPDTGG